MAKYAYVKNGFGTSTTDTTFTSLQAEAFGGANLTAANCYNNVDDVIANANLGIGDFILFSDVSAETYTANKTFIFEKDTTLISVSDSDGSLPSAGAIIDVSGGVYDMFIECSWYDGATLNMIGMDLRSGDFFDLANTEGNFYYYENCNFQSGSGFYDDIYVGGQNGVKALYKNCSFDFKNSKNEIIANATSVVILENCTFAWPSNPLGLMNAASGGERYFKDCDFSAITFTSGLFGALSVGNDGGLIEFTRCKMPASYDIANTENYCSVFKLDLYSCDNGDGYHYFEHVRKEGRILESTNEYRTSGATYDGTNHFSAEFRTNANVKRYCQPLKHKLANIELDLTTSKTLTFHIMQQDPTNTPADFVDHECWIEVEYPDATDHALGKVISSRTTDILSTTTTLSTSSQAWSGTSGNVTKNLMSVVVPASFDKAQVTVYLHVAKDITVADGNGASSIEIFACPKPEIA